MQAFDQAVRNFVYTHFVDHARPPSVAETATALGVETGAVRAAFEQLDQGHAFFLEPGRPEPQVRIANPFSAVPTLFRVHTARRSYWANCAWDMLGIPAALKSDATVEARCADCGETTWIEVAAGRVRAAGEIAHFLVPFRHWYDDLVFT